MTDEQRPLDLDAIRARADAATPGPWSAEHKSWAGDNAVVSLSFNGHAVAVCGEEHPMDYPASADAAFIAHAREDVPALLAEVTALRAELDEARAYARKASDAIAEHLDSARAERTEPATGEDVAVLRRLLAHAKAEGWTREPLDVTEDGDHGAIYHNHIWETPDLRRVCVGMQRETDGYGVPDWYVNTFGGETNVAIERAESAQQVADLLAVVGLAPATRAKRTEPATGEDVEVVARVIGHYVQPWGHERGEFMGSMDMAAADILAALDLPGREQALREAEYRAESARQLADHLREEFDDALANAHVRIAELKGEQDGLKVATAQFKAERDAANAALADVARKLDETQKRGEEQGKEPTNERS